LRGSGEVSLNRPRVCGSGRSELALVGKAGVREVLATAWGGAAMVRECNARSSYARRGQGRSSSSITFLDRKLWTTLAAATGRHSSRAWVFWTRSETLHRVARPWGEARCVGAWREWRSPACPGNNGGDQSASSTGRSLFHSCREPNEEWRCGCGYLLDITRQLGARWKLAVEQGGKEGVSGLFWL